MLQVIGAGFGRTGTMSLKLALERLLGGTCYHMYEVLARGDHIQRWYRISTGETPDWPQLFDGFVAGVDWPVAAFYADLAAVFPDSKVILTLRDPERWYESVRSTIYDISKRMQRPPMSWLVAAHPTRKYMPQMTENIIWGPDAHFGGRFEDRDHALRVYQDHCDEVRQRIPAERLLEFDVKSGWGPLCEFLGVAVPDAPFPNTNERAQMLRLKRGMQTGSIVALPMTAPLALLRGLTGIGRVR